MSERVIEADYFIIGAGACAMAFVDELLTHSNSSIVMVDRRDNPGGHWNDAYPFVRLHQPSEFYGVNSRELGQYTKYVSGLNKGLYNLASGSEVLAYFDQVMQQRFLPSGRVQYFPMCNVKARTGLSRRLLGKAMRLWPRGLSLTRRTAPSKFPRLIPQNTPSLLASDVYPQTNFRVPLNQATTT